MAWPLLLLCVNWPAAEAAALRAELARFPPEAACAAAVAFADAHLDWLEGQLALGQGWRRADLCGHAAETRRRRAAWDTLASAHRWRRQCDGPGEAAARCRGRLCELRRLLGPAAYRFGEMPPPADFRYFSRAD